MSSNQEVPNSREQLAADFYVAINGCDQWSGRLPEPNPAGTDGPFATMVKARDAVRELKATGELKKPVRVMIRNGTYHLTESVVFTAQDSGTQQCPIIYQAYPGEKPVLSGGREITGWRPYQGQIVCTSLPEVAEGKWFFRQLFFNGKRQRRACYPNPDRDDPLYGGWAFIEKPVGPTAFRYQPGSFPRRWAKPRQAEINIFPWLCWNNDIVPIEDIDYDECVISLARPVIHRLNAATGTLDFMSLMAGNRFRVENVLEELDQPGEWCLDREAAVVYFWPPTDSVEDGQVIAPALSRLIELRGTTGKPVRHITIKGLTFAHSQALFPQPEILPHNYPNAGGHAVYLEGAEHCTIEDCHFDAVGGDGIRLQHYNAHNRILNNEIAHAGAEGVCLAGLEQELPSDVNWRDQEVLAKLAGERPRLVRNVISGNHIHHCGALEKRASGVYIFGINSVDNVISHNLIHDLPHRGIMVQHGFGRNIIEYNHVHDVSLETADTGGINTLVWYVVDNDEELKNGNVIRYNIVRNVVGCGAYGEAHQPTAGQSADGRIWTPYYSWGIYLDWNPIRTQVYGNLVIGNTLGGIMMLGDGKDNLIANNILVDSSDSQIYWAAIGDDAQGNRFVRNIVYYTQPAAKLIRIGKLPGQAFAEHDYNVYWHKGEELVIDLPEVDPSKSFEQWQKLGCDQHSVVADPLFTDPDSGDFSLQPNSPALEIGFEPPDLSSIGPPAPDRTADERACE